MKLSYGFISIVLFILSISSGCVSNPVVTIHTEDGDIDVRLFHEKSPVTVTNFLQYIDSGLFRDGSFYRVVSLENQPNDSVRIEVIQGGRKDYRNGGFAPILHETTEQTGILHKNGTISMARSKVGSATSEFFICVGDQPELDFGGRRNPDGQGFAAFGKVIRGMDVVLTIYGKAEESQYLSSPVTIIDIKRK